MTRSWTVPDTVVPVIVDDGYPGPGSQLRLHGDCVACGANFPNGMKMEIFRREGPAVVSYFEISPHFQGGPGTCHGGIVSAAFDESGGYAAQLTGAVVVTAHLEVDYLRPVPLGIKLRIEAEIVGVEKERKIYVNAYGYNDATGERLATASALFLKINPAEHFKDFFANRAKIDSTPTVFDSAF